LADLRRIDQGNDPGERPADREGEGDHRIRTHAAQARGAEILRGGAQLNTDRCPLEEQGQSGKRQQREPHGDQLQQGNPHRADLQVGRQGAGKHEGFRPRAKDEHREILQEVAQRERGDEQCRRRRVAQWPERQALDGKRQRDDSEDRDADHHRPRQIDQQQHGIAAYHDHLAVSEVDEAHDAEYQADAERHEGVKAAHVERVDHVLQRQRHCG
jgi:hypothetical protein